MHTTVNCKILLTTVFKCFRTVLRKVIIHLIDKSENKEKNEE